MLQPHAVIASHFNGRKIQDSTYESVMIFFFIYILTFAFSALLLSFSGLDFLTCFSAAASAISNVGPGLGEIIGPEGNYSSLTSYTKIILISVKGSISFFMASSYFLVEFVFLSIKSHLFAINTIPFLFLSHSQKILFT